MTFKQVEKKTKSRKPSNRSNYLTNEQLRQVLEEGKTVAQVTGKAPVNVQAEAPVVEDKSIMKDWFDALDGEEMKNFNKVELKPALSITKPFEDYLTAMKKRMAVELQDPAMRSKIDPAGQSTDDELIGFIVEDRYEEILNQWNMLTGQKKALETKAKLEEQKAAAIKEDKVEDVKEATPIDSAVKDDKPALILTEAQNKVVNDVFNWYKSASGYDKHEIGGYAGVGKSTVVERILKKLPVKPYQVRLCAPTGTASLVLQSKTPGYACSTVHRLFYKLDDTTFGRPSFVRTSDNLAGVELVVLDEGYMAGTRLGVDIEAMCEKAGVKLLVTGDPGQLSPVKDTPHFLLNPNSFLDEVLRQAATNPIIAFSMKIREATDKGHAYLIPNKDWNVKGQVHSVPRSRVPISKMAKNIREGGVIISGVNKTRITYNQLIRRELGFTSPNLMNGEYVTVKSNIMGGDETPVTNGMRGQVSEVKHTGDGFVEFRFTPEMFEGSRMLRVNEDVLFERKTMSHLHAENQKLKAKGKAMIDVGDDVRFGYVITGHAAQGAQWPTVYFFNESYVFNRGPEGYKEANAWLYTIVTRAINTLVILR